MKKTYKKITGWLFLSALILLISACGAKTETRTFTSEKDGIQTEMVYTFVGDKVIEQSTLNVLPYTALGVTTQEEAQAIIEPISKQYQGIEGLVETVEYGESSLTETVNVDYQVVDMKAIQAIPGMTFSGDPTKGISMKESEKILLEQGFTEVKNK